MLHSFHIMHIIILNSINNNMPVYILRRIVDGERTKEKRKTELICSYLFEHNNTLTFKIRRI